MFGAAGRDLYFVPTVVHVREGCKPSPRDKPGVPFPPFLTPGDARKAEQAEEQEALYLQWGCLKSWRRGYWKGKRSSICTACLGFYVTCLTTFQLHKNTVRYTRSVSFLSMWLSFLGFLLPASRRIWHELDCTYAPHLFVFCSPEGIK